MPITSIDQVKDLGPLLEYFWLEVILPNFFHKHDNEVDPLRCDRKCGGFEVSFNPGRKSRPGVPQLLRFGKLDEPPADPAKCRFYEWDLQNPLSITTRPWYGVVSDDGQLALLPNGSPYDDRGSYLVIPAEITDETSVHYPHSVQSLSHQLIAQFLGVARAAGPRWVVGWNQLHAGASINHTHGHLFRSDRLPCEEATRVKLGNYAYAFGWPAGNLVIEKADPDRVWAIAGRLQQNGVPFNLMIRGEVVFVFARRIENELVAEFPAVMAVSELSGRVLVSDLGVFASLSEELLATAMRKTTMPTELLFERTVYNGEVLGLTGLTGQA